jgi:hypothetical protein
VQAKIRKLGRLWVGVNGDYTAFVFEFVKSHSYAETVMKSAPVVG